MAYDPRFTNPSRAQRDEPAGDAEDPRQRRGPHLGPIAITPTRVFLPIALIATGGYLLYAVTVRDASQIPALAFGAALVGVAFLALCLAGVFETIRAGRRGSAGRSVVAAVFGGFAGVVALGCFAAAAVLWLLAQSVSGT